MGNLHLSKKSKKNRSKKVLQCGDSDNIKSNFILKKIFKNLSEKKFLEIIKNSKKLQNRLNISINNYIYFPQIELEIIPKKMNMENLLMIILSFMIIYILMKIKKK